jgi:YYY domain-containing protein
MNQVIETIFWYLLLAGIGWLCFPIAYRYLGALPNRGIAFVRPLGLLLWGFLFWILSSYGFLRNDIAGLLTAILILAALSWWAWRSTPPGEIRRWLRDNRSTIIAVEIVFLLAFLFMTYVRASRPAIYHTEQPMELAFISAIMRSPTMPPHDPWLAGFSISYYYFGYLMVAMLAKLVGVISSIAFNLGFISIFAMAATAAYGLAHNLLKLYLPSPRRAVYWLAALAPVFVLILGNMEGLLEIMHARHMFWSTDAGGTQTSQFWAWMDIKELVDPPTAEPKWTPRLYGTDSWWWWRASRVINDRTFTDGEQELIDEFPAFSFVLGDLHPHVLSMPFVMMAMALALNVFLSSVDRKQKPPPLGIWIRADELVFAAVLLGALGFLNIWDFPIYVGLFSLAYVVREAQIEGWTWKSLGDFLLLGFALGIAGFILYLPFYLGFTSQAGGPVPNLLNPTRGIQFWVMFASLLIPISIYLLMHWRQQWDWARFAKSILFGFVLVAAFWGLSLLLTGVVVTWLSATGMGEAVLSRMGAPDVGALLNESLRRRLSSTGGWITMSLVLGLVIGLLFFRGNQAKQKKTTDQKNGSSKTFLLVLVLLGLLLVVVPDFVYLLDQFGTRMNTVFKFYFQAWQMWAIAAAVIVAMLLYELRGFSRAGLAILFIFLIGAGLIYPVFAFSDVTRHTGFNLDGASHLTADAIEAIQWLRQAPLGTLVEAVGGSYDSNFARYAAHSGQMGLIGWPGHEGQWRGGDYDAARIDQIQILYTTADWQVAQSIIDVYDVKYIVVGEWERYKYNTSDLALDEQLFQEHLRIAFQNATVTIYEVP